MNKANDEYGKFLQEKAFLFKNSIGEEGSKFNYTQEIKRISMLSLEIW